MGCGGLLTYVVLMFVICAEATTTSYNGLWMSQARHKNAYATMMYMGTPRDYEFYVATRVLIRSLVKLQVDADIVVIASMDVPLRWVRALEEEDGGRVVRVENLNNPYKKQRYFNDRFKLSLNKLYAWTLSDYERVVMLDADNLFLQKTDELFQCGQFCAVFINPCVFHTGLFVLQPSKTVFNDMIHELQIGRVNSDGADQGFLVSYFPDLLDQPMFHPPLNHSNLNGTYRLPLGYQMDASYYYLKLKWTVPCGPNSVITFPSAPWMKPWYWWSWPVLPLGLSWHETRRNTLGYSAEMPMVIIQTLFYLGTIALSRLARPSIPKRRLSFVQSGIKFIAIWSILAAYVVPFFLVPRTLHTVLGWLLYLLGSFALSSIAVNSFMLPGVHVLAPWLLIIGSLLVMACPWYGNGVIRALYVFGYAVCSAPVMWNSFRRIVLSLQVSIERDAFSPRLGETSPPASGFNKLY